MGAVLWQICLPTVRTFAAAFCLELYACGLLKPNSWYSPISRLCIGFCMGVRLVPETKLWWEPCCGRFVFSLS